MEWVAFFISIAALGFSLLALKRTGGMGEMKKEGEALRKSSADLLERLEKRIRGEEKADSKEESPPVKWEK